MKKLFVLLLVCILVLGLCGCPMQPSEPTLTYGLVLRSDNGYQLKIEEGFRQAGEAIGATVVADYADGTAEDQIRIIDNMIANGVQGIALSAADTSALKDALQKARNAGIRVVTLDGDTNGSEVFINQVNYTEVAAALLDTVLELTGGAGEFAVIANDLFSGSDPFVSSMEYLVREEKYQDLIWVETVYHDDNDPAVYQDLLQRYPDLKVICCTNGELAACCQALENLASSVRVTGLGTPSSMRDFVGEDHICPRFYLWNSVEIGSTAAYVLDALISGEIGDAGTSFAAANGVTYSVTAVSLAEKEVGMSGLYCFNEENIAQWADVY